MAAFIFCHVYFIAIAFYTEGKLRQVMVIYPITANPLAFSLFAQMPVHFCQPVLKHDKFFANHSSLKNFLEIRIS